jgi:hypothetical protein
MHLWDGVAWLLNVSSSVAIVFVNKVLLDADSHGFLFGELVCRLRDGLCPIAPSI